MEAMRSFRGSIAPASLKVRRGRMRLALPRAGFPGLYCPGLIEGAVMTSLRGGPTRFPGLYCPGLIEGCPAGRRGGCRREVSGALLPRPH